MTAGFVGVLAGTIKSASRLMGKTTSENLIGTDTSAFVFLLIIIVIVAFNIYARFKGTFYVEKRETLVYEQEKTIQLLMKIKNWSKLK